MKVTILNDILESIPHICDATLSACGSWLVFNVIKTLEAVSSSNDLLESDSSDDAVQNKALTYCAYTAGACAILMCTSIVGKIFADHCLKKDWDESGSLASAEYRDIEASQYDPSVNVYKVNDTQRLGADVLEIFKYSFLSLAAFEKLFTIEIEHPLIPGSLVSYANALNLGVLILRILPKNVVKNIKDTVHDLCNSDKRNQHRDSFLHNVFSLLSSFIQNGSDLSIFISYLALDATEGLSPETKQAILISLTTSLGVKSLAHVCKAGDSLLTIRRDIARTKPNCSSLLSCSFFSHTNKREYIALNAEQQNKNKCC